LTSGNQKRVSVVVLAWEDHEFTRRCVASLVGEAAEIIIVDNGSHEPYKEHLAAIADQLDAVLVRSDANLGFAGGMNIGLAHVTEEIVVFSNNDLTVARGAVATLVAAFDSPAVGAAFPTTLDDEGRDTTAAGYFLTLGRAIAHAVGLNILFPRLGIVASPAHHDWLSGPFVAMPTAVARQIGGVPAQSFFYSEDYRLCWTLRQCDLETRYVPSAVVVHADDASAKRVWDAGGIAQNQTRELVRAAADQYTSRWVRGLLARSYYVGCLWRSAIKRSSVSQGCLRGAREALS
jgi:N-acetylglucosaminyl-diphospho-decaprenol L-rhamnosyltransferase